MAVIITCDKDGDSEWNGEVCCRACYRVYQLRGVIPPRCACGVRLLSIWKLEPTKSIVAICPKCYQRAVEDGDGIAFVHEAEAEARERLN